MDIDKYIIPDVEKESIKFLERDFNQCFQQLRHYDSQIFDTFKFLFTSYTALVGVALGLYQFGNRESIDLRLPGIAALIIGLLLGLFMYIVVIRDRVYFVQVTRYINEQRCLFFRYKPLGFENYSKMYTDPSQPPFFDWRSSQLWYSYIIALMNSILLGTILYICEIDWLAIFLGVIVIFTVQLITSTIYLCSRQNKSAEKAVFGKESYNG